MLITTVKTLKCISTAGVAVMCLNLPYTTHVQELLAFVMSNGYVIVISFQKPHHSTFRFRVRLSSKEKNDAGTIPRTDLAFKVKLVNKICRDCYATRHADVNVNVNFVCGRKRHFGSHNVASNRFRMKQPY